MIQVKKKKVIKKIKWKAVFKCFFLLFVILIAILYLLEIKTKNIIIEGNDFVSDNEIIMASGLKDYPKLFKVSTSKIKKDILTIPYIDSVKIHKSLIGTLTIQVEEAKPIFYNRNKNVLVLTNGKELESDTLNGVPILLNYVPDSYYEKLIKKISLISPDVLNLINEIEYQPWKSNDVMIDDTRFFLRMNDTNQVYVNLINFEKLNNYIEIYASLEGHHGILYLDSSSDKISFSEFK